MRLRVKVRGMRGYSCLLPCMLVSVCVRRKKEGAVVYFQCGRPPARTRGGQNSKEGSLKQGNSRV